jgi:TrkA-C domain
LYAAIILTIVALTSLLITRVAAAALTVTGMPRSVARFQARSALTGVGFTTTEAESVVNHPVRRRIIMSLMLAGNIGLAAVAAGLMTGFLNTSDPERGGVRAGLLVLGLAGVYLLSRSAVVDRHLSNLVGRLLHRYTDLPVRDYEALLRIAGEYSIREVAAHSGGWLVDRPLGELRLRDEGVSVLGIVRTDGSYEGVPGKDARIRDGDTVIAYGRASVIAEISERHRDQ